MFYVYILKSEKSDSYYIGSCSNIKTRLSQHNSGVVKSTKRHTPWKLVYYESCENLKKARQREKQIKSWKKRSAIEKLLRNLINRGFTIVSGGP